MPTVTIVYHSGYGHTAKVAEAVAEGARGAGATVHVLRADELPAPDADGASAAWEPLDTADAIIFGSPTYMGSVTGPMEQFFDHTSSRWAEQAWRDKWAAGFTCSGSFSGDKQGTLMRMTVLAAQQGMNWINLGLMPGDPQHPDDDPENLNRLGYYLGVGAQAGDVPPEEQPGPGDLATARHLGARVAGFAAKLAGASVSPG